MKLYLYERLCEPTSTMNLVLDGQVIDNVTESVAGDVYWRWEDEPDMEPQYLGTGVAGHDLVVPFDLKGREIRLFLISKTGTGDQSVRDIKEAEQTTLSPPLLRDGSSFFDRSADATTAGTSTENLYTYTLPAGSLATNGDKILVEYSGIYTANANQKRLQPKFGSTVLITGDTTNASATDWFIRYYLIRVSNTVVRYNIEFGTNADQLQVDSAEITGLDLDATAYAIDLDARTPTTAGHLTAKLGYGVAMPASL